MKDKSNLKEIAFAPNKERIQANAPLHPAWQSLIRYCVEMQHGEIGILKIQDGVPVLAEITRKKVKFS